MPEQGLKGRWRIGKMDKWDRAFIEFLDNDFGSLHFGCVYANLDYRLDDKGRAEFSFCGDDKGQEVFGRGWVKRDNQGLYGSIFFHEGEQSDFEAIKDSSSLHPKVSFKGRNKKLELFY